jgi:hypothetical protein
MRFTWKRKRGDSRAQKLQLRNKRVMLPALAAGGNSEQRLARLQ